MKTALASAPEALCPQARGERAGNKNFRMERGNDNEFQNDGRQRWVGYCL